MQDRKRHPYLLSKTNLRNQTLTARFKYVILCVSRTLIFVQRVQNKIMSQITASHVLLIAFTYNGSNTEFQKIIVTEIFIFVFLSRAGLEFPLNLSNAQSILADENRFVI